ncbi:hypothetical protein JHK84_027873 [Glycine max]|nr:hypothetical protein JHK84_027873 [Glycine max]
MCPRICMLLMALNLGSITVVCSSGSSSPAITADRLVEIIQTIKQEVKKEVEDENKDRMDKMKMELDAIKSELSQIHTQQSAPPRPSNPDVFVARVSTKESCAEAANNVVGNERSTFDTCSMGFYIDSDLNVRKPVEHSSDAKLAESSGSAVGGEPIWTS